MSTLERHPADLVRLGLGVAVFGAGAAVARMNAPTAVEIDAFRLVNDLPGGWRFPVETVMQLGTFGAVVVTVVLALVFGRYRMALSVFVAGVAGSTSARVVRDLIGRGRPLDLLTHVAVRGPRITGSGFPSGHTTTAAALAAAAAPYLPRRARRTVWVGAALVAVARVYVGAHLPLDVVGGFALGAAVGAIVNLALGTPRRDLDAGLVQRVLAAGRYPVRDLTPIATHGGAATPFLATAGDGTKVFVKAIDRERRDADAFGIGRSLPCVPPRRGRTSVRDRAAARRARSAALFARGPRGRALGASDHAHVGACGTEHPRARPGRGPDDRRRRPTHARRRHGHGGVEGGRVPARRACIAHRHLSLDNVMLDAHGQPWIVDFGDAEAGASDRALAQDVAELLASLALVVGAERAVATAVAALGKAAVTDALPLMQPLALTTTTRRVMHRHRGLLDEVRNRAADAVGAEHVKIEPLTRVRWRSVLILACLLVATYLLLPQVGEFHRTLSAARHADPGWLVLSLFVSAGTFLAAALSLSGAVLAPVAFGRTFVTQLASSFANKITPAGLGGMGINVRYLERSGVSKEDAVGAVALNGTVGFVVHVVALALSASLLGHTGLPHVHLPDGWILLAAAAVVSSVAGVVLETSFGRKHVLLPTERTGRDLLAVVRRPTKAVQMFTGAFLVLASYVLALGFALTAFHAHASWLEVTAVYLGGSAVASAAPTPGKVGAVEAALIAGLTGVGIASGPAVAGVLAFRLATFWLPIIPGYLAFHSLTERDLL